MLWSKFITFRIGNGINAGCYGSILFEGHNFCEILYIESSGLQVLGEKDFTNSFAVTGFAEGNNLIAIKVKIMNDKGTSFIREVAFFVNIQSKKGILTVNTNENFLAFENGRVGAIDDKGYIAMQIGKDIFTTNPMYEEPHHFISEKNVCCKYFAGRISADEVMKSAKFTRAATKFQEGKEIKLREEIDSLKAELEKQNIYFQAKYEKSKKETNEVWKELGEWRELVNELKGIIKPRPCYIADSSLAEKIKRIRHWLAFRKNLKVIIEGSPLLNRGGMGDA